MAWTLKRLAISAFLILHLAAVGLWNLPGGTLKARCAVPCAYYLLPLGLWQYWGMFAPTPARDTVALEAVVADSRGLLHVHPFPRTADLSPWRAAWKFRDAKFTANLSLEEMRVVREMAARHAVRALGLPASDFPAVVQLQYQVWSGTEPGRLPPDPPEAPTVHEIEAFRFPTWEEAQP